MRIANCLLAICLLTSVAQARIVAGPWLQAATETSIVVMWESDGHAGSVEHGETESYGQTIGGTPERIGPTTVDGDTPAFLHEIKLSGLRPGVRYYYRVRDGNEIGSGYQFVLPAPNAAALRFLHTSNPNAYAPYAAKKAKAAMLREGGDFVVISGDISNKSTNNDFRAFFSKGADLTASNILYICQGNHDSREWSTYTQWMNNEFPGSYNERFFTFQVGPARFVGVDDSVHNTDFPVAWFEKTVRENKLPWLFLFLNGNYKKKIWIQSLIAGNRQHIDVILTGGRSQSVGDDGILYLASGSSEYVFQSVELTRDESAHRLRAVLYSQDGVEMRRIERTKTHDGSRPPPEPETEPELETGNLACVFAGDDCVTSGDIKRAMEQSNQMLELVNQMAADIAELRAWQGYLASGCQQAGDEWLCPLGVYVLPKPEIRRD